MSSLPAVISLGWTLSLAAAGWILVVLRARPLVAATEMQAKFARRSRADLGVSPLELNR